jgi:hypothetical protein
MTINLFNEIQNKELFPIHKILEDNNQKELDKLYFGKVLIFPDPIIAEGGHLEILRLKLGQLPSIQGNK